MFIDTHTHPLMGKDAKLNMDVVKFNIHVAEIKKIDVLCITEHLDAIHYRDLVKSIFIENQLGGKQRSGGIIEISDSLLLSSGCEISIRGGADIGVHTAPEVLFALNPEKGFYTPRTLHVALKELTDDFIMVAHHLYNPGKWIDSLEEDISLFDAIECPGKDIDREQKYKSLATSLGKPAVSGSDSHTWIQLGVGRTIVDLDRENFNIKSFKKSIRSNNLKIKYLSNAKENVSLSKLFRKAIRDSSVEFS